MNTKSKVIGGTVIAAMATLLAMNMKTLVRYIRMSTMAGATGRYSQFLAAGFARPRSSRDEFDPPVAAESRPGIPRTRSRLRRDGLPGI